MGVYFTYMKKLFSNEMIKKNKQIKKRNLEMEKNIEEVIKYFEIGDNVKLFLENSLIKQKSFAPDLSKVAKERLNKEINKTLKIKTLKILIENAVTQVVSDIAYELFEEKKEQLKQDFFR